MGFFLFPSSSQSVPLMVLKSNQVSPALLIKSFQKILRAQSEAPWFERSQCDKTKQGITNKLALAIRRCCTSTYCVHTLNTKTIHSNLNSLNTFTKETSSSNVKPVLIT